MLPAIPGSMKVRDEPEDARTKGARYYACSYGVI
jgi:hypothetical protein